MATKTRQAAAQKTEDAFDSMIDDDKEDENKDGSPKVTVKRCEDPVVWQQRKTLAERNQAPMWRKWSKWYEMMYAIKSRKGMAVWKSKLFIPIMAYKAWTMIAKLINLQPGFAVKFYDKVYSQEDRKHVDEANLKLEYDYDNPFLGESIRDKQFDTLADTVVCGTGFAMAPWVSGTRKVYTKFKKDDGTIDYSKANVEEIDYGWNDLDPIDAFNVLAAPGGRTFEKKPWIIVKFRKTKSQLLESDLYDEAVIDKLKTLGKQNDTYTKLKQSKNKLIGSTKDSQESMDDTVDSFDVFECYEKTNEGVFLVTYAEAAYDKDLAKQQGSKEDTRSDESTESGENGMWYEIRNEKQPYWHNMYPLVPSYIRRRPHDSWGESIFEITESMANGYNDIVNQMADNLAIVGNGGILMHETGTVIYDFYYAPGGEVRYSGTKPEFETPESPDLTIFTTLLNLLETGLTNATVSPYASGTPADAADSTDGTAAGIQAMQEAAGDIMSFMKTNFMQFVKGIGIRWLSNNCQFFDDDLVIESSKYGKRTTTRITSDSFNDKMVLTIDEASMEPATKDQRIQNNTAWLSSMIEIQNQSFIQAGLSAPQGAQPMAPPTDPATGEPSIKPLYFDLSKLAQEISEEYGKPDLEEFLLQPGSTSSSDPNAPENDNKDLIAAIREHVDNGEIEPSEAQPMIDAIEGRYGNTIQQQAITASQQLTQGDQTNATPEQAQPQPSVAAAGSPVPAQ